MKKVLTQYLLLIQISEEDVNTLKLNNKTPCFTSRGFYIYINCTCFGNLIFYFHICAKPLTLQAFMRILSFLLVCSLVLTSCSKFAKVQKSTDYDYKLKMANEYYEKKKYNFA